MIQVLFPILGPRLSPRVISEKPTYTLHLHNITMSQICECSQCHFHYDITQVPSTVLRSSIITTLTVTSYKNLSPLKPGLPTNVPPNLFSQLQKLTIIKSIFCEDPSFFIPEHHLRSYIDMLLSNIHSRPLSHSHTFAHPSSTVSTFGPTTTTLPTLCCHHLVSYAL